MWRFDTLYYEVSKIIKIPPGNKSQGSRMIARHSRPLALPHCRPLEVLVPESFFLWCSLLLLPTSDIYGSCGSRYLESLAPIVFWELSKVPGILVIGKCTILGVGFLRVFMALYGYLRHF